MPGNDSLPEPDSYMQSVCVRVWIVWLWETMGIGKEATANKGSRWKHRRCCKQPNCMEVGRPGNEVIALIQLPVFWC